jgi:hypothetical protein
MDFKFRRDGGLATVIWAHQRSQVIQSMQPEVFALQCKPKVLTETGSLAEARASQQSRYAHPLFR